MEKILRKLSEKLNRLFQENYKNNHVELDSWLWFVERSERSQHVIKFPWLIIWELTFWFSSRKDERNVNEKDKWSFGHTRKIIKIHGTSLGLKLATMHVAWCLADRIPLTAWHLTYGRRMTISRISFARNAFPKFA